MNITRLTQARSLFPGQRCYQRQWVRSIRMLGEKWLLACHAEKLKKERHEHRTQTV
jgi:hypothetical protein